MGVQGDTERIRVVARNSFQQAVLDQHIDFPFA